ncbi:MAG TPA: hypothetical protein VGE74_23900 [Gemmata sp.]
MSSETSAPGPTAPPGTVLKLPQTDAGDETTVFIEAEAETVFTLTPAKVARVDEPRIASFVETHRLNGYVDAAVHLARECFPNAKNITLEMFGEPGEYGERLYLEVATRAGVDEVLHQRSAFVTRWVATTPPWVTDLMGISTDLR